MSWSYSGFCITIEGLTPSYIVVALRSYHCNILGGGPVGIPILPGAFQKDMALRMQI